MDLRNFKIWLVKNNLDDNELFDQSIKCYQIEAHKAAYLYSYLGFVDFIKNVIVNHPGIPKAVIDINLGKPQSEIDKLWKKRLEKLDSEDSWEAGTIDFINQGTNTNIFQLKDNIRNEFITKKDLRNVCAHNKTRPITNTTVEDLWDFINYSQPYFVVNGSMELWKENFERIIRFTEKDKYEFELSNLYNEYRKWQASERKVAFAWILDNLEKALEFIDYNVMECTDIFLKKIFEAYQTEEYQWIKDGRLILYCLLNINNYKCYVEKIRLQEYVYANENAVLNQMIPIGSDDKNCEVLELIYSKKNFHEWWSLLSSMMSCLYTFNLSEGVMDIIIASEKIEEIFEQFQQNLYTYKTSYGNQYSTDTFDYRNFGNYCGEVKILILLIKSKKLAGEMAEDLVNRCKKILKLDYSSCDISSNYSQMYEFFKRDSELFNWLNI